MYAMAALALGAETSTSAAGAVLVKAGIAGATTLGEYFRLTEA